MAPSSSLASSLASSLPFLLDIALLLLATMRVTRVLVTDDLGKWYFRDPVKRWRLRKPQSKLRARLHEGTDCGFCTGFHVGWLALLTLFLAGGPGDASPVWRYIAGAFALNYIAAHIGSRLGDAGYSDE